MAIPGPVVIFLNLDKQLDQGCQVVWRWVLPSQLGSSLHSLDELVQIMAFP